MKQFLMCIFLVLSIFTFSQNKAIKFESDTLVRGFYFPFKYIAPVKCDTLLIEFEGCTGKLMSDSLGFVFADSLSSVCEITLLKIIDNDTVKFVSKSLIIEDLKPPKLLVGGVDIMNLKQKRIEFYDFKLMLINVTQPNQLLNLNFFLSNIVLVYNGNEINLQGGAKYNDFEKILFDIKKGEDVIIKSYSYMGATKKGRHEVIINKTFTRVGLSKSKYKFIIE